MTATPLPGVSGLCDPRFDAVRDAFAENFSSHKETGACVCLRVGDRVVVDLWGGWRDAEQQLAWGQDTLVNVFSVGKAMAATCVLQLVERGAIDLDRPVAYYWPEFAAEGKGEVLVRELLAHRAAVPGFTRPLPKEAFFDRAVLVEALAGEAPWWEPGTTHGYHVNTFGLALGELVRRATGEGLSTTFRQSIALPLEADFHFGIGPEDDDRIAVFAFSTDSLLSGDALSERIANSSSPPSEVARTRTSEELAKLQRLYSNPEGISGYGTVNSRTWRAAEHPSSNAHGNARSISRIYEALANPDQPGALLAASTLAEATTQASNGIDAVLGRPSRFGLGYQLTQPERPLGPSPRAFGHFGAGGSLGFVDPDAGVAFGYAMNQYGHRWQDPRNRALIDALYQCL